tara:strand:+ start:9068 stop:9946 length:879 start_codon:yes stop_codon:yes gene_type:complete
MSLVSSNVTDASVSELPTESADVAEAPDNALENTPTSTKRNRLRFVVQHAVTSDDLANGFVVPLKSIVHPTLLPQGNVIVREIGTNAISSALPIDLTVSTNVFNTREDSKPHYSECGVDNTGGWLSTPGEKDSVPDGFVPILNIMPNEYNRNQNTHYQPTSLMDEGLVAKYGHLTSMKDLWQGIIPFPGEDYYYVGKDHVVLNIIEKNWEQLGINIPTEKLREERWVKVSSDVVNKVINELNSSVLQQIPFSNVQDMEFYFAARPEMHAAVDRDALHPISVEFTMEYGSLNA